MKNCIFLLAIAIAAPAQGAIVLTTPNGYGATGITGLIVNGNTYDVTFGVGHSFDSKFGLGDPSPTLPTFYFDAFGAIAARDAILAAINSHPAIPIEAGPNSGDFSRSIDVAYRYELDPTDFFRTAAAYHDLDRTHLGPWIPHQQYGVVRARDFRGFVFADFTLISTPEPASLAAWLGLLAAGAITYRRRRQQ